MRLAFNCWQPSDSTVGAWATHWKLPASANEAAEREIWLWDFGGQADQRLIHQLYMEDTTLAVLVFDGQKENLFDSLGQWDRDLSRASKTPFTKLLAAGRVDSGGKVKQITLPGNRLIITSPGLHVTVTNLADLSKHVTLNATGSNQATTAPDGSSLYVFTGRNISLDPVAGFVLAIGHFSIAFDANGNLTQSLGGKGQLMDICAMIQ